MHISKVEDPRPHWEKFRRRELYAIASLEGLTIKAGSPATTIRLMLLDSGADPYKYMPQSRTMNGTGEDRVRVDKNKIKTEVEVTEEQKEGLQAIVEDVNIESLKMHELRTWCKQHGIKTMPRDKKVTLIEKAKALLDG